MPLGKPNIVLPLASSYDERGVAGFTDSQTNDYDQRKINCFYEVTKNAITGSGKIKLSKRPGISDSGNSYGVSGQTTFVAITKPGGSFADGSATPWVFGVSSLTTIFAADSSTSAAIVTASGYIPAYVDKTLISGVETIVLQIRKDFTNSQRAFYSATNSVSSFIEITHTNFTSLVHKGKMESMDGFTFVLDNQNRIFTSSSNSLAAWGPADFITKQVKQDFPVGLARLNNQILAFGNETVEVFYNAGNTAGSPLSPIRQLHQKIGLSIGVGNPVTATHYYAIIENRLYFIGRKAGGASSLGLYVYNGSSFQKISTQEMDKILSTANIFSVNSVGFNGNAAIAISFTDPLAITANWLMFFPEWNDWFEWKSTIFQPVNSGSNFLGLSQPTKTYIFSTGDAWADAGTSYTMQTQFKLPNDGAQNKFCQKVSVTGDTSTTAQGLLIEFSDDDYQTWNTAGTIDLTQSEKYLTRLGRYYDRAYRITSTTAAEVRLSSFNAWVSE